MFMLASAHRRAWLVAGALSMSPWLGCDSNPYPGNLDCGQCSSDQVCWYTTDVDGDFDRGGCLDLPTECVDDKSCDCIDAVGDWAVCDQIGGVNQTCEPIEETPVVFCSTLLG